jgi:hypothetical protein
LAVRCVSCPRENATRRLRAVANYGRAGGYLLEYVTLCESCAILRADVL